MTYDVIKYVYIHFDAESWTQALLPSTVMQYTAVTNDRLSVVAENIGMGDTTPWTYHYSILQHDIVYVIGDMIHIPRHYSSKNSSNQF